jgi:hypothetical protein
MEKLETLHQRINAAFVRIEAAALQSSAEAGPDSDMLRQLTETNVQLAAEVDALNARRLQDADDLDRLIRRLKPLVGEAANA